MHQHFGGNKCLHLLGRRGMNDLYLEGGGFPERFVACVLSYITHHVFITVNEICMVLRLLFVVFVNDSYCVE